MGDIVEFTTVHGHHHVFYRISSNAINFEIKAPGSACIGLVRTIKPEWDYMVAIGDERRSWIKKLRGRQVREVVETPNILSGQEYRRFWVSWNGSYIRLGGEGHANPIVSCDCKASDIRYVTFFVTSTHYNYAAHWRVEMPPILEKPITKPLGDDGELTWVPVEADTSVLPDGSLIGGYENENLYVIRAKHRGSLTPGKFVPAEGVSYISWGGEAHVKNVFEVLTGYNCKWVPTSKDRIPVGAIVGGHSENIEHEKLYVGRAKYLNHVIPGKVQPSHKVCYIAHDGKEIGVDHYEILINPETSRCANTLLVPNVEINIESEDDEEDHDDAMYEDHVLYNNFLMQDH